ncbi:hypothetical protein C8J56DRAFT_1157482 [Mycena floridula]|nr:hypothetical protein C8J56DRAFT_1157482 [Mycena floridula]
MNSFPAHGMVNLAAYNSRKEATTKRTDIGLDSAAELISISHDSDCSGTFPYGGTDGSSSCVSDTTAEGIPESTAGPATSATSSSTLAPKISKIVQVPTTTSSSRIRTITRGNPHSVTSLMSTSSTLHPSSSSERQSRTTASSASASTVLSSSAVAFPTTTVMLQNHSSTPPSVIIGSTVGAISMLLLISIWIFIFIRARRARKPSTTLSPSPFLTTKSELAPVSWRISRPKHGRADLNRVHEATEELERQSMYQVMIHIRSLEEEVRALRRDELGAVRDVRRAEAESTAAPPTYSPS